MADNRHFTDALQNEGGSPVYLEDKKLAERTAVSGAASIANLKFLLANDDTEGFNTAIKAYIDEAIRSALGALVNNLDKGTAISRILATDGNNDLGTITPANLASVLGAESANFNNLTAYKTLYALQAGSGVTWSNAPFSDKSCLLVTFLASFFGIQIAAAYDCSKAYMRSYWGNWSAWKQIELKQ